MGQSKHGVQRKHDGEHAAACMGRQGGGLSKRGMARQSKHHGGAGKQTWGGGQSKQAGMGRGGVLRKHGAEQA